MVPGEVAAPEPAHGSHHLGHAEARLDDVPAFVQVVEMPAPAVLVVDAQGLVLGDKRLGVVYAVVLQELVEVLVVREEFAAAFQLVGKALAEVPGGAELGVVGQHRGQYARVVLPGIEIELRQYLPGSAGYGSLRVCKQAVAGILGEVEPVVYRLFENLALAAQGAHDFLFLRGLEVRFQRVVLAVGFQVEPMQLEQQVGARIGLLGNLHEGRHDVLAGHGVAAVATHLHVGDAVEKREPALGEQKFERRVHCPVLEREHLGGLLHQQVHEHVGLLVLELGEHDVVVVDAAVRALHYGNHAVVDDVDARYLPAFHEL